MATEKATEQPTAGHQRRSWWKWSAGALALALLAAVGTRQLIRYLSTPALIARLPSVPDLSGANPSMARAIEEADAAARRDVHSDERVGHLGMVYHANLLYDRAAPCYELAAHLAPRDHRWPYYLGLLHETAGRTEQALPFIERAAELSPETPWIRYRLANILLKLGRLEQAGQAYRKIAETDTHRRHGLLGLAEVAKRRREWQKVIDLLAPAVEQDPDFGPARHALAAAYEALDMPAKARSVLPLTRNIPTTLPARDPLSDAIDNLSCSSSHLLKQAVLAQRAGDGTRAGELLQRLVRVAPEDPDSHLALSGWCRDRAKALQDRGLQPEAESFFQSALQEARAALELAPTSAIAHNTAGITLRDLGDLEPAIDHLTRAVELDPNLHVAHHNLAVVLILAGKPQQAVPHARKAVRLHPGEVQYLNDLGVALKDAGDVAGAMQVWRKAIQTDPGACSPRYNLAQALVVRGDLQAAAAHLRAILGYEPDHAQARELYAWVLAQMDAGETTTR
jgi:tetratricopeptide (TPR) repeat protein